MPGRSVCDDGADAQLRGGLALPCSEGFVGLSPPREPAADGLRSAAGLTKPRRFTPLAPILATDGF
jgi:hypothetical protein